MTLNQDQKDLLIGTLLGDGNLQTNNKGRTWRYRALHKLGHKEYLFHKYEIMKPLCNSPPIDANIWDERMKKYYQRSYFNTLVRDELRHYGNLFYTFDSQCSQMVKDVPKSIEHFLTPQAIAFWYMDDGSIKELGSGNIMRICTESFSEHGVKRLQKALSSRFGIEKTSLSARKNSQKILTGYRLMILEGSALDFRDLIQPYLVPCMKYKVTDGHKGHL